MVGSPAVAPASLSLVAVGAALLLRRRHGMAVDAAVAVLRLLVALALAAVIVLGLFIARNADAVAANMADRSRPKRRREDS